MLMVKNKKFKVNKGFTLIEVLLSVALIAVLFGISIPVFSPALLKNDLESSADLTVQSLRRAQVLSQAVQNDSQWGIKVQNYGVVLFRGNSFSDRDTAFDEFTDFPTNIDINDTDEFVFEKLTGRTTGPGNITLTLKEYSKIISVNSMGAVEY